MKVNFEYQGEDIEILVFEMRGFPFDASNNSALVITGVKTHVDDFYVPNVVDSFVLYKGKRSQVTRLIGIIWTNDGVESQEQFLQFVQRVKEG